MRSKKDFRLTSSIFPSIVLTFKIYFAAVRMSTSSVKFGERTAGKLQNNPSSRSKYLGAAGRNAKGGMAKNCISVMLGPMHEPFVLTTSLQDTYSMLILFLSNSLFTLLFCRSSLICLWEILLNSSLHILVGLVSFRTILLASFEIIRTNLSAAEEIFPESCSRRVSFCGNILAASKSRRHFGTLLT